jgi:1,4-alpha-glucan branching enzyme
MTIALTTESLSTRTPTNDVEHGHRTAFARGEHRRAHHYLGAHWLDQPDGSGVRFAVWAPNAQTVSVIGDFNGWQPGQHPLESSDQGIWSTFVPDVGAGALYKFAVQDQAGQITEKTDPFASRFEIRPKSAGIVEAPSEYAWGDETWLGERATRDWLHEPMSIYEVHLGSWQRGDNGEFLNYTEIAQRLAPYVRDLGFTHIELLPVTEFPFDASWGYQVTGYFAPTSRHGSPDEFRQFVDVCHQHGLGIILDWVPAHFPTDEHGLARFDGTALFEHDDPRLGFHHDWGTLIFNYGRFEVCSFLISSAIKWIEDFHIDGLRVDAVASMLYLDYSRDDGDWVANVHGGNENIEAIEFLRALNRAVGEEAPGALTIAEESTAWPQVTRPPNIGGLGFSMKWNMGWMNDTLSYIENDPVHRKYHHDQLTFGLLYAHAENYVLPFSHDEVVHGKRSLYAKMPGDDWHKRANLRLLYSYMFTYPGKKLMFMGGEIAQHLEWDERESLEWHLLDQPEHQGVQRLVADLNHLYREQPALHRLDFEPQLGFQWIDCHDYEQSVVSFLRRYEDQFAIVCLNFTPVPRHGYRIGVPEPGEYRERLNSDSHHYGGSNIGNGGSLQSEAKPWMNMPHSLVITLPPLSALVLLPSR